MPTRLAALSQSGPVWSSPLRTSQIGARPHTRLAAVTAVKSTTSRPRPAPFRCRKVTLRWPMNAIVPVTSMVTALASTGVTPTPNARTLNSTMSVTRQMPPTSPKVASSAVRRWRRTRATKGTGPRVARRPPCGCLGRFGQG